MITNIRKNCMGTLSIEAKFNGMRKSQEFIVYPMHQGNDADKIMIQSDSRIGYIFLNTGIVRMSPPRAGGSYAPHLIFAKDIDKLSIEDLAGLKFRLVQTADSKAGSNVMHIFTDNSAASNVAIF